MKKPKKDVRFALGTHVVFTRRAAVARKYKRYPQGAPTEPEWVLFEGASELKNGRFRGSSLKNYTTGTYGFGGEMIDSPYNKIVHEWDEEGSGVIIGLVKRQEGFSHRGSEDESGYLEVRREVWLYAVKTQLDGVNYLLCPLDAVRLP